MTEIKKKKVLIADGGDHYKILEQMYHMLKSRCDLTFYVIDNKRYDYTKLFPSIHKAKVINAQLRGMFYFAKLLFIGSRYDIINISTGPDGQHYTELFRILCFYLCCLLYGRKMVVTLRNVAPYLESTPGLYSFLRSRSIRFVKKFTFETHTMRRYYEQVSGRKGLHLGVSFDKYADVHVPGDDRRDRSSRDGRVRVGLLGQVLENRRDYRMIKDALKLMNEEDREKIEFVTLGACRGGANHPAMQGIAEFSSVDAQNGMLSEQELVARGWQCHVLMAPLSTQKAYGTLHGSGSFGDAVYFQKRLVLPQFADKDGEYGPACLYYSDARELADVFSRLLHGLAAPVDPAYWEQFTCESVFSSLMKDLKICEVAEQTKARAA